MSLSYQIYIRIALSVLLILIAGAMITLWHARTSVKKEIDSSVSMTAHIITCGLSQQGPSDAAWLNCIRSLKETRHLKIELLKPNGEVVDIGHKTNEAAIDNPPPVWFVNLAGGDQARIDRSLTTPLGEQFSLVIQSNPLDEIKEVWQECLGFFGTILGLTLLAFLSVYLTLKRSIISINRIVSALENIKGGQYGEKLPEFVTTEYNSIAKAINHMMSELNKAQQKNRALTQHSLEIQETERKQLAQELHDELGQSLTAIKIMAATANLKPSEIAAMTESISRLCDDLINVVRNLMYQLHPQVLTELGLKAALEDLVAHWQNTNPSLKLQLNCGDDVDIMSQDLTIQVFRVVQECLTNIVRHADANQADISLIVHNQPEKCLSLSVKDNGKGCSPEQLKNGFGLLGMRERVLSQGGYLTIDNRSGKGMEIRATIPLLN